MRILWMRLRNIFLLIVRQEALVLLQAAGFLTIKTSANAVFGLDANLLEVA